MSDAIDLTRVQLHATPPESVTWQVTKRITSVELRRGDTFGLRVTLTPYNPAKHADTWPDRIPAGWDGTIRWTLCLAVGGELFGVWHGAAFQEMWHDRAWTGAPLHTHWADGWADARGWAGPELTAHRPQLGDPIVVWAVAGQLRMNKQAAVGNEHMLTVRERSNAVQFTLAETALYTFPGEAPAPPVVTPPPVIVPPTAPPDESSWKEAYLKLSRAVDNVTTAVQQLQDRVEAEAVARRDRDALVDTRLETQERRAIPTRTKATAARVFGLTVPIPPVGLE